MFQLLQLTIKSIHLSDLSSLMIPSQQSYLARELGLVDQELGERLETVIPSINKVSLQRDVRMVTIWCAEDLP